ncbi:hypothetical protein PYW08_005684 [Mythimna loreyi]|uniref:Uncharacterized protein n=1 Tax=Mythimna loreyi TaxID=667449 RepID=A0ACC2QHC7_9NEOP|nr:hypothetical protein PYW08_005684 [Mythimna loreyi]
MESINRTINDLSNLFSTRMTEFEKELQKSSGTAAVTTSGLAAEFTTFRTLIVQALHALQQQVGVLSRSLDNLEMRGRRKILLLHGVAEEQDEETAQVVTQIIKKNLKLDLSVSGIKRCHRMGRSATHKPRPILLKLHDMAFRDQIWFSKTKLKGSGITISEFLTRARHNLFMAARDRFGVTQCWTTEGTVIVLDSKGTRHRVTSFIDLDKIKQQPKTSSDRAEQVPGQPEPGVVHPVAVGRVAVAATKTKRTVAKK